MLHLNNYFIEIEANKEENIFFTLEDIKDFPIKIYELKTSF